MLNEKVLIMRKIAIVALMILFSAGLNAQMDGTAPLARGEKQINFGVGLSNWGLPVYFSVDFAVHKDVTLTPEIHMRLPTWYDDFSGGVMFKADYHWNYLIGIPRDWDFYSGLRLGINFGDDVFPDLGLQVGGRWYWNETWGLNLEFAGGAGFGATFGLSARL